MSIPNEILKAVIEYGLKAAVGYGLGRLADRISWEDLRRLSGDDLRRLARRLRDVSGDDVLHLVGLQRRTSRWWTAGMVAGSFAAGLVVGTGLGWLVASRGGEDRSPLWERLTGPFRGRPAESNQDTTRPSA
ncbi:MAG: hypothetical protein RMK29_09365 [Myxococcales bacterium]|nr:hypothetical protein [Myxococcota bacterium]MDW8281908.1 hypothetical protein [Myxococcales bacterium]